MLTYLAYIIAFFAIIYILKWSLQAIVLAGFILAKATLILALIIGVVYALEKYNILVFSFPVSG